MSSNMKTVLVALCLVLVFESIATKRAFVLFFSLMCARSWLVSRVRRAAYCRSIVKTA